MIDNSMYEEKNPGQKLQALLMEIYPFEHTSMGEKMDFDIRADGEFEKLLYFSSINYLVRRFITTAKFFYRKYPRKDYGEDRFRLELEKYFNDFTGYKVKLEEIIIILVSCVENSEKKLSPGQKKKIEVTEKDANCYICGEEYNNSPHGALTIDHVWPKALGGDGSRGNLRGAHSVCNNQYKQDFIDSSDFHYEEISLVHVSRAEYYLSRNNQYETAIFSKTNYCCSVCGKSAQEIGKLYIGRKDPNDSWHFLNLLAFCVQHLPRYDETIDVLDTSELIEDGSEYDNYN
jgi:hypothetical protein